MYGSLSLMTGFAFHTGNCPHQILRGLQAVELLHCSSCHFREKWGGGQQPVSPIIAKLVFQRKSRSSLHTGRVQRQQWNLCTSASCASWRGERRATAASKNRYHSGLTRGFCTSFWEWEHDNVSDKTAQSRILRDRLRVADVFWCSFWGGSRSAETVQTRLNQVS